MLALDNSIGCIEASESDILVLYRSLNTSFSSGGSSEFREAYVCAIRKTAKVYSYLALIADNGRVVVYTKPGEPDTEEGYHETVEEALAFARSLGFNLEPVNLNYSSAMREVVVRNIRILRPPASKMAPLLKNGKADAPTPVDAGRGAAAPKPSAAPQAPPPQTSAAHQEIDELKVVRGSLSNIKIELSLLAAEKNLLAARLQEMTELQEATATELARARKDGAASAPQLSSLRREVSVLSKQLKEANSRNVEAAERIAAVEESLGGMTEERDAALRRMAAEKDKAAREKRELRTEVMALTGQRDEAQLRAEGLERQYDQAVSELEAARAALTAARTEVASEAAAHAAALEEKLSLAGRERDALRRVEKLRAEQARSSREVESLRTELSSLQARQDETLLAHESLQRQYAERESELNEMRSNSARTEQDGPRGEAATAAAERDQADGKPAARKERKSSPAPALPEAEAALVEVPHDSAPLAEAEPEPAAEEAEITPFPPLEEILAALAPLDAVPSAFPTAAATVPAEQAPVLEEVPAEPAPVAEAVPVQPASAAQAPEQQTAPETAAEASPGSHAAPLLAAESSPAAAESSPAAAEPFPAAAELFPAPAELFPAPAPPKADPAEALQPKVEAQAPPFMTAAASSFPTFCDLNNDFFSSCSDDVQVFFMLQPGVGAVGYTAAEDVVQLYRSVNVAYLSPEGKGQETCQGYICCLKTEGGMSVQAALYGVQSAKTWVYLPEEQPADEAGYTAAVRGAIAFAEQVGLMMEAEKPGMSPEQRLALLQSCPVLKPA